MSTWWGWACLTQLWTASCTTRSSSSSATSSSGSRSSSAYTRTSSPSRAATAAACLRTAAIRPSSCSASGRSWKISARISASAPWVSSSELRHALGHRSVRVRTRLLRRYLDRPGGQVHREQRLRHRVVQLTGQPVPLLQRRLALELGQQPRVVDGDRHLVGHRGEEVGVGIGGVVIGGVERAEHSEPLFTGGQRNHGDGLQAASASHTCIGSYRGSSTQRQHVASDRRPPRLERLQGCQWGAQPAARLHPLQVVVAMPGRPRHAERCVSGSISTIAHATAPVGAEHVSGHPVQHLLQRSAYAKLKAVRANAASRRSCC